MLAGVCLLVACTGGGGGGSSTGEVLLNPAGPGNGSSGGIVRGRVTGDGPVAGIPVFLIRADADYLPPTPGGAIRASIPGTWQATQTAADGSFEFAGVPAGLYNAIAQADRYHTAIEKNVTVLANTVTLTLTLTATGDLSGRITYPADYSPLGVAAFIVGTSFGAFADATGNFTITGVPVGTHTLGFVGAGLDKLTVASVTVQAGRVTAVPVVALNYTAPPTLLSVAVTEVTSTTAKVSWTANQDVSGLVEYGPTTSYGAGTGWHASYEHAGTFFVLTGLAEGRTYHLRVKIRNVAGGIAVSTDQTFTTPGGLVAYYPFNNNANDESGHGNNGILNGAPTFVTGVSGTAMAFDGADDYVRVPDADSLDMTTRGTLAAFVKVDPSIAEQQFVPVLTKMTGSSDGEVSYDLTFMSGVLDGYVHSPGHTDQAWSSPGLLNGAWHHVALTWDTSANQVIMYQDGLAVDTKPIAGPGAMVSTFDLYLGRWRYTPSGVWHLLKGALDEVRIFNRPLTATEITALAATGGIQTGQRWVQTTANAAFSARHAHESVVFNNKMWVIGGYNGYDEVNDVWSSTDGVTWTQVTANAGFHARNSHGALAFNGKMWVFGGVNAQLWNDVWSSSDGVTWTEVQKNASFTQRAGHSFVVFDSKMWVIGGLTYGSQYLNDVWSSSDGLTWSLATSSANFPPRRYHTSFVFNNRMWVVGGDTDNVVGNANNDIWSSTNGITWQREAEHAAFPPRVGHRTEVFSDGVWIFGGSSGTVLLNDVWKSNDGRSWSQVSAAADFTPRDFASSLVFNGKIWLLGGRIGSNNTVGNDVWSTP